jgi:hypothetical protein
MGAFQIWNRFRGFSCEIHVQHVTKLEEIDLANPEDKKLRALEEGELGDIE